MGQNIVSDYSTVAQQCVSPCVVSLCDFGASTTTTTKKLVNISVADAAQLEI